MRRRYDTDLSNEQWELVRPLVESTTGRKATVSRREIVNAILYMARTGCQWRNLPHDFPHWSTVYSCYHRWAWRGTLDKLHAELLAQVRSSYGKSEQPILQRRLYAAKCRVLAWCQFRIEPKTTFPSLTLLERETQAKAAVFAAIPKVSESNRTFFSARLIP